jgi:hypothetical protein
MTGMRVEASAIIRELRNLLNDRYDGEFAVLKELIQNADDAGARRLVVAAHPGFDSAHNPLLRSRGVLVGNDGGFSENDAEKMASFSSSTKMEDVSKVGRFGLGQKAVFHLCDAFVAYGWTSPSPGAGCSRVVNPFVDLPLDPNYAQGWEDLPPADQGLLDAWLRAAGFEGRGLAIVLPLRSPLLVPAPGRSLSNRRLSAEQVFACFDRPPDLLPIMAGLRHLERISFQSPGAADRTYLVEPGGGRLEADPEGKGETRIGGRIRVDGELKARHVGRQAWAEGGRVAEIAASRDWPLTEDPEGRQIREKAVPHGATIVVRTPSGPDQLRLHWSVFLPVSAVAEEEPALPAGTGTLDLVLHGYFFVDSGRKKINFDSGGDVRSGWNCAVRDEATLPLLLPVVAEAISGLGIPSKSLAGIVRAIAATVFFREHALHACGDQALAEILENEGTAWRIVPAAKLRPLPKSDILSHRQIVELLPTLSQWSAEGERLLCFGGGAILAAAPPQWQPGELAELISLAGPRAAQRRSAALSLAALLGEAEMDDAARHALAAILRAALGDPEQDLATDAALERIVFHLRDHAIFSLPPSVEHRRVLAVLAGASARLPVKANWARERRLCPLDGTTAINFLTALEPLLEAGGAVAEEAAAAVRAVIAAGPPLSELLDNDRARRLRVVHARDVANGGTAFLTLEEVGQLGKRGLLFRQQPGKLLKLLGAAVRELPIYEIKSSSDPDAARFMLRLPDERSVLAAVACAPAFGPARARGELLVALANEDADVEPLRALCAGAPVLPRTSLLELDRLPNELEPLARALLDHDQGFVLESSVTGGLATRVKKRLGIERLDAAWIGKALSDAFAAGRLPEIDYSAAQALLISEVPENVLALLPLHLSTRGERVVLDAPLYQAKESEIPASLRGEIALLAPWKDPEVEARQRRLVPRWSPRTQVERALSSAHPERHAAAILDGVESVDLGEFGGGLRDTPWIAVGTRAYRPADILTLDPATDAEARALFGDGGSFLPLDRLPRTVRQHPNLAILRGAGIFPDQTQSHQALAMELSERGDICGCLSDPDSELQDLRTLACAGADLALPGWPLLRTLLANGSDDDGPAAVARALSIEAEAATVEAHLNALAAAATAGAAGEAARRLHRSIFQAHARRLANERGFLPASLLLKSRGATYRAAGEMAASGEGIASSHLLDRDYAKALGGDDELGKPEDRPAPAAPEPTCGGGQKEFVARLEAVLEPWRDRVPSDAVIFLLGLLGRDAAMATLAAKWAGSALADARQIWGEIDAALAGVELPADELARVLGNTRFIIEPVRDDSILVLSAAGTQVRVPLSGAGEAMLLGDPLKRRRRVAGPSGKDHYEVPLSIADRATPDQQAARRLFEQFILTLAPALLLCLSEQKQALIEAFDRAFAVDQALLDDTQAELRDIASERVRGLKVPDGAVREALLAFDETRHKGEKEAKDAKAAFWDVIRSREAADELLAAVRAKIADMGYSDARVLFELFQNADDSLAGWSGGDDFRIEVERDQAGLPSLIRVVHWGRPINRVVPNATGAIAADNRRDLANMLAIGHSDKRNDDEATGKFGLGFKTTHMLSSDVRIASGYVAARISGGLIPQVWDDGFEAARALNRGNHKATLIELPIDTDARAGAERACIAFRTAAPWLTAFSRHTRRIEWEEGGIPESFRCERSPISDGLTALRNIGASSRRSIQIDLGRGYSLLCGIGRAGPEKIELPAHLWHLVPLDEASSSGWILNGPFRVDPGRTQIAGTPEENVAHFRALGQILGERLVALFDSVEADWDAFARHKDVDPAERQGFWRRLVRLLAADLDHAPESHLHFAGRGLGHLATERPVLTTGTGDGLIRAGEATWQLAGALAASAVWEAVRAWPATIALSGAIVTAETATLMARLELPAPRALTLATLLRRALGAERQVAADLAALLGAVVNRESIEGELRDEKDEILALLQATRFLAEDGSWQPITQLSFPASTDESESQRAAFVAPDHRLSSDYSGDAEAFAEVARSRGYHPNARTLANWARTASDPQRQRAFLRYLLMIPAALARATLDERIPWLPPLSDLETNPLLSGWTAAERSMLLLLFGFVPSSTGTWTAPDHYVPPDADGVLEGIHDWWLRNGDSLRGSYRSAVYPEGFDLERLHHADDLEAWFTMFALAAYHTIGRTQAEQPRNFVSRAMEEGWWSELAESGGPASPGPWIERLRAWSEPLEPEEFMPWRRCLVDLHTIARYLPDYIEIFRTLPQIIAGEGEISMRDLLNPGTSPILGRMSIVAASIDRSLGIGVSWMVRELYRHGIFAGHAVLTIPYGWCTTRRVRRLLRLLDLRDPGRGADQGRLIYETILGQIGPERALFAHDLDLPLQLITKSQHRPVIQRLFAENGGEYRPDVLEDEDD